MAQQAEKSGSLLFGSSKELLSSEQFPALKAFFTGKTCFLTGGGGYVGQQHVRALVDLGIDRINVMDVAFSPEATQFYNSLGNKVMCFSGDITDYSFVLKGVKGCALGLHVASYGMSGAAMLDRERVFAVNVGGTENVIRACLEGHVGLLLYISSYNVVFNGQVIVNGDNTLPLVPDNVHLDAYSRTKCIAEKMVVASNCAALRTCALRPAGIYGEGEKRHFSRIIKVVNQGLGFFAIGAPSAVCDWVHVDNLVFAAVLALRALAEPSTKVGGKAYFVSDGYPINNFDFIKQILGDESLFWLRVPYGLMFYVAWLTELIHGCINPMLPFEPFLSRAEVCKVGASHYMSLASTKADISYVPLVPAKAAIKRASLYFAPLVHSRGRRNFALFARLAAVVLLVLLLLYLFV